jgi:multicomponent K+:H+ antiporter subunit F
MTAAVLPFVTSAFVLALVLALWRLARGPALPDRILALDTMYVNAMALLVLLGIMLGTGLYFEAALIIALLGFIGTVVLAKFLLRGDVIEVE